MRFIDEAIIEISSGDGGSGCLSFRREKFIPRGGPDGGDGGSGGNINFVANESLHTLQDFKLKRKYKAQNGKQGKGKNMHGKDGIDTTLEVPPGTMLINEETDELLCDMTIINNEFTVARGGKGGLGNARFKTSTNRAPRKITEGKPGEIIKIRLELKVLADVGLLGQPNAGKSTLISKISSAKPKIAEYPFTTLSPNLGVVKINTYSSFVVADIPGLIPGASEGVGLGIGFLKHLSRVKILLHLIDVKDGNLNQIEQDFLEINKELKNFNDELIKKEQWVILSQIDKIPKKEINDIKNQAKKIFNNKNVFCVSSISGEGLKKLLEVIGNRLKDEQN
ncbi:MAG: GTPase ObgE [Gammaproteobacteria bacterium TMED159]|nr:MAG: GTPase ObgE [Gammaproteobacteria bacterium TMED159]